MHRQMGEDPRTGQLWEKKQDNWPKVNKDPEELPCINDLTASLLHPSFRMPTPLLSMCVFLPCQAEAQFGKVPPRAPRICLGTQGSSRGARLPGSEL